jgi:hypothetical protein
VKKIKKLALKKVTLRNLDEPTLQGLAAATGGKRCDTLTCPTECAVVCKPKLG